MNGVQACVRRTGVCTVYGRMYGVRAYVRCTGVWKTLPSMKETLRWRLLYWLHRCVHSYNLMKGYRCRACNGQQRATHQRSNPDLLFYPDLSSVQDRHLAEDWLCVLVVPAVTPPPITVSNKLVRLNCLYFSQCIACIFRNVHSFLLLAKENECQVAALTYKQSFPQFSFRKDYNGPTTSWTDVQSNQISNTVLTIWRGGVSCADSVEVILV